MQDGKADEKETFLCTVIYLHRKATASDPCTEGTVESSPGLLGHLGQPESAVPCPSLGTSGCCTDEGPEGGRGAPGPRVPCSKAGRAQGHSGAQPVPPSVQTCSALPSGAYPMSMSIYPGPGRRRGRDGGSNAGLTGPSSQGDRMLSRCEGKRPSPVPHGQCLHLAPGSLTAVPENPWHPPSRSHPGLGRAQGAAQPRGQPLYSLQLVQASQRSG